MATAGAPYLQKYVLITALSGSGKSFLGDYLELYCGMAHVDGDHPAVMPEHADKARGIFQAFREYWFPGKDGAPAELWQPYAQLLCDWARAAGEQKERVALTWALYSKEARAFVRDQLGPENVCFVQLDVDIDVLLRGHMKRAEKSYPAFFDGKTPEQVWNEGLRHFAGAKEKYGEWGFEAYKQFQLNHTVRGMVPLCGDEGAFFVLDGTARDDSVPEKLRELLGLPPPTEAIDAARIEQANLDRQQKYKKKD